MLISRASLSFIRERRGFHYLLEGGKKIDLIDVQEGIFHTYFPIASLRSSSSTISEVPFIDYGILYKKEGFK